MNPLRAIFLSLSKMPPAVMLLVIIGLAVIITMSVTSKVAEQENQFQSSTSADGASVKQIVISRTLIPAGSKIEAKQIGVRSLNELDAWDDAAVSETEVVGATTKHAIPAHAQVRKIDLE